MLLLISENKDDSMFAKQVAHAVSLPFEHAAESKKASSLISKNRAVSSETILIADLSAKGQFKKFYDNFGGLIGEGANKIHPNNVHFIGYEVVKDTELSENYKVFSHFIVRNYVDPKEEGKHYGRVVQGFRQDEEVKISNLLSPKGSVKIMKLKHSREKNQFIESLKDFLVSETEFVERSIPVIITAVDELLMNAIYDAPTTADGSEKFVRTRRSMPIELQGRQSVEVQMGYDGEYAAFTVVDRFGSVNKPKLLSKVFSSYEEKDYKVDPSRAGAGLGLATTFRTGGSLLIYSKPFEKTAVTVFFKETRNYREFKNQFRFISVHVSG